ncbi:Piso0_002727 [Millerozyma farinosa CBS 7064]|uniref:Piso0_002727 protein n=1 Tax=Pichia sorbitophila (strain ATCC MYA-4447 / BCRC 22081 / CBS 7064 / NBRC 10061 / NRRL Y-12695) TaxID=559304 RepID=G8YDC6_PICSO|nr:Piso0_002727 [Millerozyma farinosa CBS 7064]
MIRVGNLNRCALRSAKVAFRNIPVHSITYNRTPVVSNACAWPIKKQANHFRYYSVLSQSPEAKIYDYKRIKEITSNPSAHPDKLIIDVREPVEFEDGHIPNAINIPFKSSPGALDLSDEDFKENFGFDKPSSDKELIFYCLAGVRSAAAEELANTFGYQKRGNYVGSYEDWASNENKKSK